MTNRFCNPDDQYADATGLPYAGGFMFFYASGTSTPVNTYSDIGLTIPNTNPIVLDSAGRPGSVFLQNLAYKVVLEDVNSNIIWTMDPVSTSDFTATAQFSVYPGNPNGHVAGTAGSGSIPSSVVWDNVNDVLYVATTTGTTTTTVWTAVNPANASTAPVPIPGGYLTLTSSTPIIPSDVVGATSVFYTPFKGNICPVYNGSAFVNFSFLEQTLSMSTLAADSLYDVWAFSNAGVFTIATGPAWTTTTPGSSARGSGAGTTQLQLITGVNVNAVSMSLKNGATTYSVASNQATYLGTIYTDHTAGQTSCHRAYGQNRKWGVWNAYNRADIYLKAGDGTASWSYSATKVLQASNNVPTTYSSVVANVGGSASNGMTILCGLAEEVIDVRVDQDILVQSGTTANGTTRAQAAIGVNSVTGATGLLGQVGVTNSAGGGQSNVYGNAVARYLVAPFLGLNQIFAMEAVPSVGATVQNVTYTGQEAGSILGAWWRG